MDSERTQVELYVTQYNRWSRNVDDLRGHLYLYGFLAYISVIMGRIGHSYVWASILTAFIPLYWLATTVMRCRMTQVSHFQGALFGGLGSVLLSLYTTCVGLVYVEIARLGPGYYVGVLVAWGICTFLHFCPALWRVRRGKLTPRKFDKYGFLIKEFTYEQRKWGTWLLLAIVVLFILFWVAFAKLIYPRLGRAGAPMLMVLMTFMVGQVMEVGVTGLLKAYYIKKYNIPGESRPARDERWEPKPSLGQRIWFGFWKWFMIILAILILVGAFMLP